MHRIFFDSNDRLDFDLYGLWLPKSLEDLAKISDLVCDGLRVVIYSPGEFEMEAHLEFNKTHNVWTARGITDTQIDYYCRS
jgi:hypothetical protein